MAPREFYVRQDQHDVRQYGFIPAAHTEIGSDGVDQFVFMRLEHLAEPGEQVHARLITARHLLTREAALQGENPLKLGDAALNTHYLALSRVAASSRIVSPLR